MKYFLFLAFLILLLSLFFSVSELDIAKLSTYGKGYLAGKIILILSGLTGVWLTGRKIFICHFRPLSDKKIRYS